MSHMNESCHIWMSRFSYKCVLSHMTESYHTNRYLAALSASAYSMGSVTSHMNESYCAYSYLAARLIWMSHITHEGVVSHMSESCHTWLSHVTYKCILLIWMSNITHMVPSGVISVSIFDLFHHVACMWVVSRMNESVQIKMSHVPYEWIMSHIYVYVHISKSCPMWLNHIAHGFHHITYEWVMSHMNESCPIWMGHVPYEWVVSHILKSCPM